VLGFRTPYEPGAAADGALRVLALGDSFTWGDGIADDAKTWPVRLETKLREERDGAPVEVINLAQRGFTTANQAELLRRLGWAFEPDLLLVQFFINDVLPSSPDLGRRQSEWLYPRHSLLPDSWRQGAIRRSAVLELLERAYSGLRNRSRPSLTSLYRDDFEGWRQLRTALHEMAEAARARGGPAAFLLFPRLHAGHWSAADHPDAAVHGRVVRAARAAGFRVLDLTETFAKEGQDGRRWWAQPYDAHPNAPAHALVAERIARWAQRQGWLETKIHSPHPKGPGRNGPATS
jgi:lysophospholipase L1-like esterase